jgi:hypothetical protein
LKNKTIYPAGSSQICSIYSIFNLRFFSVAYTDGKKWGKFFLYVRKFRRNRVQSHI